MPLQALTPELAAQIAADYPALQSLNLSNNALRNVLHLQLLPQSLTQLDLSRNCLSALPEEIGTWLPALRLLRLRENALESLRPLSGCRCLQTLDVGANHVTLVSELQFLQPLTQLRHLSLDGNPLAKSPTYHRETLAMLPLLQTLDDQAITAAERLYAKLHLKTQHNNEDISPRDPSPALSPRLLTPESLQTQKNCNQETLANGVMLPNEMNQEEMRWKAENEKAYITEERRQPSPPLVATTVPPLSIPFQHPAIERPEMIQQARKSDQQGRIDTRHAYTVSQSSKDKFSVNVKRTDQSESTAALNANTKEALLTSRVEALEGILAIQDRTMRQTLVKFGEQSLGSLTNPLSKSESDVVLTVEAAALVYTRLLATWREKCVALMVQAQSNELANEALTHELRQQKRKITEALARCEVQLETWQQRAADFEAQRDLEVVAKRQAETERVQATTKTIQAVRVLALERGKLQTVAETVVRFTDGLVRDKVDLLHGGSAKLQALERRLVLAKERVELASTLLLHREARLRNSEAALEADRRVWAHRLEQMRSARLQDQQVNSENNGKSASVLMRPPPDGKLLRPATETALRNLFHRLDCYDTGLVQSHELLQALRRGDPTVLNAVGGPKKLSKLVTHIEAAFGGRTRATLTWGEFLLLFIPKSSMSIAAFSEDCKESEEEVESWTRLSKSNNVCCLCTAFKNNELPSWPFASAFSTLEQAVQIDKKTKGVSKRSERKAFETLSHAELAHQVTVLKSDRQHLWCLLARDAHDLRDRVSLVRREWEAKTSELVFQVDRLQQDLKEQANTLLNVQRQQERAEVARDEALLESQRLRELLSTQKQDFELQKKKQEAETAERLQHEHDIWQTEIQDVRLAHSLLQSDHGKQQVRIRQLERDLARQKEALLAHETQRVVSLEDKVCRRDAELARLRRERNTILDSLREHEQKLAMANAVKELALTKSIATQTEQTPQWKQKSVACQTRAVQAQAASDKRIDANDYRMSRNDIAIPNLFDTLDDGGAKGKGTKQCALNNSAPKITSEDVNLRLRKLQTLTESLLADD